MKKANEIAKKLIQKNIDDFIIEPGLSNKTFCYL